MGLFKGRLQPGGIRHRLDNCNNSERSSKRFIRTTASSSPVYETNAADMTTYQLFDKRSTISNLLGHKEVLNGHFWISVLTECLSCYIYVFIVCSTRISWTGSVIGHEPNLLAMAFSSGIAMMLLILTFRTVHVNPALTIAFFLTGRISLLRTILYILVQCLGAIAATTSLYSLSVKGHAGALGLDNPHEGLSSLQVLIVEIVISFVVTLTTYATCNYSSYVSARKFVLEQAVLGQNSGSLLFSDLSPTSNNCDNILPTTNNAAAQIVSRSSLQQTLNGQSVQQNYQMNGSTTAPHRPKQAFRVHPQQQASTDGGTFLADMCTNNEKLKESDYDCDYENGRMYANSQQQKHLSSNSDSSPIGSTTARVPPIEELMQNESQLLAANGFSLHVTFGQALSIGLAYTLTSLSGIPASGASLNPARSLGPAFIMSRWDHHWIYWLGPIVGAIIAGFFYEFVFNPTRKSSLCYLPKLFRLSAHDMAKVCSKSRLFHQHHQHQSQSQKFWPNNMAAAGAGNLYPTAPSAYRPHLHQQMLSTMHNSPNMGPFPSGVVSNAVLSNHNQHPSVSASLAQLQTSHLPFNSNNIASDNINYVQQPQHQTLISDTNFDRSKSSTAIINFIANKQQGTINLSQQQSSVNNFHSASTSNGSSSHSSNNNNKPHQQQRQEIASDPAYDDPSCVNQWTMRKMATDLQPWTTNNNSGLNSGSVARRSMLLTRRKQPIQLNAFQTNSFQAPQQRPQSMQFSVINHNAAQTRNNDNHYASGELLYHVPTENSQTDEAILTSIDQKQQTAADI